MPAALFGRTHRALPSRWLRLLVPDPTGDTAEDLLVAALDTGVPLDLSVLPAVWGAALRNHPFESPLLTVGGDDIGRARDATQAADFVQAHLLQTLSCLGRERVDFYFIRIRGPLEEFQIAGALECLESARQDGHVGHLGLFADAAPLAVLGIWQFHDAFDALLVHPGEGHDTLAPMARERRVGVVSLGAGPGDAVLTPVRSVTEVRAEVLEHA
ncbi:MAG TPA: hypothetical protein PLH94_11380 [Fimbriimonadaceae bacterium]|nr:hypothetical protein [Fimbriimonadaceae bacterium]